MTRPPLPPPDPALPRLAAAFDADVLADAVAGALAAGGTATGRFRPTWVRYKPGASCIVRGTFDAPGGDWATVAIYAGDRAAWVGRPGGRLSRLARRADALHGPAVRAAVLPQLGALVQRAPLDRKLPWLVAATRPGAWAGVLGDGQAADDDTVEWIRHVPERKAVLRLARPDVFIKLNARRSPSALARWHRVLAAHGLPVGRMLGFDDAQGWTAVAALPGRTLRALRDDGDGDLEAWAAAATAAVQRLHALPAACRAASGLARRTAASEAATVVGAAAYLDGLRAGGFGAGRLAEAVAAGLAEAPWRWRVLHGDWHDQQVLVGPAGVQLVDFDDAALGEPALDLGTFVAHVAAGDAVAPFAPRTPRHPAAPGVRDAVQRAVAARDATAAGALALHEAAALLRLAVHPFRRLDPAWPDAVAAVLAAAGARLADHAAVRWSPAAHPPSASLASPAAHPPPATPTPTATPAARTTPTPPFTRSFPAPSTGRAGPPPVLDPALPRLAAALEPERITAALAAAGRPAARVAAAAVARHKPGRRCLVRYDVVEAAPDRGPGGDRVYGKLFASGRGPRVWAAHAAVHAAVGPGGPRVPEPLGWLADVGLVLLGEVPGETVTARLCAGDVALAARIGAALAALHRAPAALERRHGPADELAPLAARVARLAAADARLGARAATALARLDASAPGPRAWRVRPIHRDLHPEQVLVDGAGCIGFVDLDDASLGEPAVDVGNFAAHLVWLAALRPAAAAPLRRAAHAFQRAHAAGDPGRDAATLRWCEAAALLRLADVHLATGGVPLATALTRAAAARLADTVARAGEGSA